MTDSVFTRTQTGSLVSRMEDVNETQRSVGTLMSESVSVLLNLVLVLAAMFWLSWQLSLVALAVVPLFVLPGKAAGKRSERLIRQEMQLHGELSAMTAERSDVSGVVPVSGDGPGVAGFAGVGRAARLGVDRRWEIRLGLPAGEILERMRDI